METMLIRESYKVVRSLDVREDYAFLEGVNIRDREKSACLLNLYEGKSLPVYLDLYDRMGSCPGFREMFIADGTLVTVFDPVEGPDIDQVFFRGADVTWQERLEMAELLLHKALTLSELPSEIGCAAMLTENLIVDLPGRRIRTRWHVAPMGEMNGRELVYLTVDQLRKILLERFASPKEELAFLDLLEGDPCHSVVQLYSLWRQWQDVIRKGYEAQFDMNVIRRWFGRLWRFCKRKWKRKAR